MMVEGDKRHMNVMEMPYAPLEDYYIKENEKLFSLMGITVYEDTALQFLYQVKTLDQARVIAKKSQDPNSPYLQMMQKIAANSSRLAENGSSAELVAKVILNAVSSQNPNLRYLAGTDVEEWVKSKNSMTDMDFHNMIAAMSKLDAVP